MENFVTYSSLIGVVLLGGFLVFLLKEKITQYLKYILAFSGAFMLSIAVLHIIPEVYVNNGFSIGIFVLFGFLIQLILEYFSQGIEHGHIRAWNPIKQLTNYKEEKSNLPYLLVCWITSVWMTYSILFFIGKLIFKEWYSVMIWGASSLISLILFRIFLSKTSIFDKTPIND